MKKLILVNYLLAATILFSCKSNLQEAQETSQAQTGKGSLVSINASIEKSPNDASLYVQRAHMYEAQGQLEPAVRDAEKAVSLDSTKADWYMYLSDLYMKRPYVKGAIVALQHASTLQPDNKELYLKIGKMFFEVKNRNESFRYLNQALKADPYLAEAFFYRGYNYRELNMPKKAIENFEKAVELKPGYYDAYLQLGLLYSDMKDKRAEGYYTSALSLKPNSVPALYGRGLYYQSLDSTAKAIKDYEAILRIDPTNRSANYNLGYNYYQLKKYKSALEYFTKAIDADPAYAEAYYSRSMVHEALGNKAEAKADSEKYEQVKKEQSEATDKSK